MDENAFVNLMGGLFNRANALKGPKPGLGDDCAVLDWNAEKDLLLTCDTLVQGTHFLPETPVQDIAHKLLAVNLSDLAAMAGAPHAALLSITVPKGRNPEWLKDLAKCLEKESRKYALPIVGGDTVGGQELSLTLAMLGQAEKGKAILRSTSKENDLVLVTGRLGGSFHSGRHQSFEPRLKEAFWLRDNLNPSAMMDISDGLAQDGERLALASNLTMALDSQSIPCHLDTDINGALRDGEDFELLFTLPKERFSQKLAHEFGKTFNLPLTTVGHMQKKQSEAILLDGNPIIGRGYEHF